MIVDSKEKFEKAIVTAMDATSEIYESMETYLRNAEMWMKTRILGEPLYLASGTLPEELLRQMEISVSLRAFKEAIPFLDLVLTPTGFGIVSNANLAPASKDRVDRLSRQTAYTLDDALDTLILMLQDSGFREIWAQDPVYLKFTSSLYWTAEDLRTYAGRPSAHRTQLLELQPVIHSAQQRIGESVSRDYLESLIGRKRRKLLTPDDELILPFLLKITGLIIQGDVLTAGKELDHIVNLMEQYPDKFPEYINSQEYQIKQTPVYENKKRHSTYFFG